MPTYSSKPDTFSEPMERFYPPQGMRQPTQPIVPPHRQDKELSLRDTRAGQKASQTASLSFKTKSDDTTYLTHRHPILLQRLYNSADALLSAYPSHDFVYDAYPDYLSLQLMRDRILRENATLTEDFLQAGCPIHWLQLLTDTVITELLCRMRCTHRSPNGDASTTSVQSFPRS